MAENTENPIQAFKSLGVLDLPNTNIDTPWVIVYNTVTGRFDKRNIETLPSVTPDLASVLAEGNVSGTPVLINNGTEQTGLYFYGFLYSGSDGETRLGFINPTDERTINFPDKSGTVALTSDITISDLQAVLEKGSEANITTPLNIQASGGFGIIGGSYGSISTTSPAGIVISGNAGGVQINGSSLGVQISGASGGVDVSGGQNGLNLDGQGGGVSVQGGSTGFKYTSDESSSYTDRSIPDVGYVKNGFVPYTGATDNVDLGDYEIKAFSYKDNAGRYIIDEAGIVNSYERINIVNDAANALGNINALLLTADRNYELPNASGIIALQSYVDNTTTKRLYSTSLAGASTTGTETISYAVPIKASDLGEGILSFESIMSKVGTAGNGTIRVYRSSSATSFAGALQLMIFNSSTAQRTSIIRRDNVILRNGSSQSLIYPTTASLNIEGAITGTLENINYDFSVDHFLLFTVSTSGGDTVKLESVKVTFNKN